MEKNSENSRKTTKSYALKIFQESSVAVVSSIAHTTSKRRRVYKALAFLLCLTGFLYQSGTFIAAVLQYPTTVGINILRPDSLSIPAFTFCDNNDVNRRIFCSKFSDKCEKPTENFCKKYSSFCAGSTTLVPKKEYFSFANGKTLNEIMDLNVKMEDFVKLFGQDINENVTGPYLRIREETMDKDTIESSLLCYSLYDRVNNSLGSLKMESSKIIREAFVKFQFKVREEELFIPGNQPGILFAVHSPYLAVNPFDFGIFMRPGRKYLIFVSTEAEVLLPQPYPTNCVNYSEVWEKNGRTGPRLQEMCRQKCFSEISLKCFNCVMPQFLFGERERFCTTGEMQNVSNCPEDVDKQVNLCFSNCRDDCKQKKFSYTVQERFSSHFNQRGEEIEDLDNTIHVEIYLEGDEIVELKHSPKYMFVEVFSNIGGFIGCWLGINLLDITDIMDGFFRITRYSFKRR